jgi:hypothetical protein
MKTQLLALALSHVSGKGLYFEGFENGLLTREGN